MKKSRAALNINCATCPVKASCVAKDLNLETLQWLNSAVEHYQIFEPGEHIFRCNDPITYIFALRVGSGKEYAIDHQGEEYIHDFYSGGDLLGLNYAALSHYPCSAVATEKTFACFIPIQIIREPEPMFYKQLLSLMCEKLKKQQFYQYTTNAKKRVAAFFLSLISSAELKAAGSSTLLAVQPTNLEISRKIGIASETLSRILSEFAVNNWLVVKNHLIYDYNLDALNSLVGLMF